MLAVPDTPFLLQRDVLGPVVVAVDELHDQECAPQLLGC